jgi:hypothetical protein
VAAGLWELGPAFPLTTPSESPHIFPPYLQLSTLSWKTFPSAPFLNGKSFPNPEPNLVHTSTGTAPHSPTLMALTPSLSLTPPL